jgi:drug/metabolite transporter (DMT)-like permease
VATQIPKVAPGVAPQVAAGFTQRVAPHLALLVVQIAFASQAVESKIAMSSPAAGGLGLDPFAIALLRMTGAAAFFHILRWLKKRKDAKQDPRLTSSPTPPLTWRDHGILFLLSLVGITVNQVMYLVGLRRTTSVVAALLAITIPISSAILSVVFGKERMRVGLALGLGCSSIGIVTLTGIHSLDWGAVLLAANSLSYACYVVFSCDIVKRLGAAEVVTWIFTWGMVSFAPFGARALLATCWTGSTWMFAVYVIAVPTILAYTLNAWALARIAPSVVTGYIPLQPLLAGLLAWVQRGQPPGSKALIAAPFVLFGVLLVGASQAKKFVPEKTLPTKD